MKTLILILASLGASSVFASQVQIQVNGMVCSFCAQGIEKKFKAEDSVSGVKVNLEAHQVSLDLKEGKTLDDARIKTLLTDAGYTVEKIERK